MVLAFYFRVDFIALWDERLGAYLLDWRHQNRVIGDPWCLVLLRNSRVVSLTIVVRETKVFVCTTPSSLSLYDQFVLDRTRRCMRPGMNAL